MPEFESAEFVELFTTYTAAASSIGAHFADFAGRQSAADPMIVATGTDVALYPGSGGVPVVQPYRVSTRGFKELAAVSHLGPAMATLVRLYELDPSGVWRADAQRLLASCKATRAANSAQLWRDQIAVRAFTGRENAIAAMIDYSCSLTERVLARALDDPSSLTMQTLEKGYLDGTADDLPVPFNRIMIATFFLTGMDFAHRIISWFDDYDLAWERAMVIIAGQSGRPTAGVTRESNSVAGIVATASRGRLKDDRLFIAPHAPVFPMFDGTNGHHVAALETPYRRLWSALHATADLGARMFTRYPRFSPRPAHGAPIDVDTATVHEKPAINSVDDWFALVTRLRVVMEDPRQLLSNAVTDYAARQLVDNANEPLAIIVPGLDGETYPHPNGELT